MIPAAPAMAHPAITPGPKAPERDIPALWRLGNPVSGQLFCAPSVIQVFTVSIVA
jgi:hypothetical protein